MKALHLSLLLFLSLRALGQNQDSVDRILQRVEQAVSAEEKIKILNDAATKLKDTDLKKSYSYATQANQLASEINNIPGIIDALLNLGRYYTRLGQHDTAMENYFKALAYSEEIKNDPLISRTYNIIGNGYYFKMDVIMALRYYKKALGVNPEALSAETIADLQNNIALIYTEQDKLDSAQIYFDLAAAMYEKLNLPKKLANTWLNYGDLEERRSEYQTAIEYYQKALKINRSLSVTLQEGFTLNQICGAFIKLNKLTEAKVYGEQALAIGLSEQFHPLLILVYENLYTLSKAKHDLPHALAYHEKLLDTKQQLFDTERNKQMEELRTKYESEQMERENKKLQEEATLIEKQLFLTRLLLGLSIAFTLIVSILAYSYYKALIENKKTKADLLAMNLQIQKQKEELWEQAINLANANDEIRSMNINLERLVEEKTLRILQQSERLIKYAFQNAHNVRGPLARLMGLVGILRIKEIDSAEVPFILNEIEKASAELDAVIKEINTSLEDLT